MHDKQHRDPDDPPFNKLSKGSLDAVPRGWFRSASRTYETTSSGNRGNQKVGIQVVTWKDKKQVSFLTTNYPRSPKEGGTTKRYVKGRQQRIEIPCPTAVQKVNAEIQND